MCCPAYEGILWFPSSRQHAFVIVFWREDATVYESVASYPGTRAAARREAKDFKQVRHRIRWCVGCRVMLIQNRLYGVDMPRLGLMNGAMGTIVGAYWPEASPESPVILVRFPTYTGDAFYAQDPKVVPVGFEEIRSKTSKGVIRCQAPLRLAHGITGHKSQGLSLDDYVVVSCRTTTGRAATAICGWAFVCFTRARHPKKVAILGLPSIEDFLAARQSAFFETREAFELDTDERHERTLLRFGMSAEAELAAHLRSTDPAERAVVGAMVESRGVAAVPACALALTGFAAAATRSQQSILVKKKDLKLPRSGYRPDRVP